MASQKPLKTAIGPLSLAYNQVVMPLALPKGAGCDRFIIGSVAISLVSLGLVS
jgi:hypothetical protein